MDFQAASAILVQTVTFLIPVIVALLGYWLTKRNQLELTRWRERLDLINSRLNTFYGPLYVLSEVGFMAYKTLIDKMGGEEVFRKEPIDDSVLREWQIWVENIFIPLNKTSEDLIIQNAHLIREEEFPESLFLFIMHASLYKAMLAKWKQGDYREYLPKIDYPFELREYATKSYRELKHEQLQLIGKMKPKQMQRQNQLGKQ
jgi:hypothetical protein